MQKIVNDLENLTNFYKLTNPTPVEEYIVSSRVLGETYEEIQIGLRAVGSEHKTEDLQCIYKSFWINVKKVLPLGHAARYAHKFGLIDI